MVYSSLNGNLCVELKSKAQKIIETDIARFHSYETGGILIGNYDANLRLATVYSATKSPPDSSHGLMSFERGTNGIIKILEKSKTGFLSPLHYLGEWHSHPNNSPIASQIDLKQMQIFAKNKIHGIEAPLLLIVGGSPGSLLWQFSLHKKQKKVIFFSSI